MDVSGSVPAVLCQIFTGMFNLLVQTQTSCLNCGASVLCTVLALWIYWRATLIPSSHPKETSIPQQWCIPRSNLSTQPGSSLNIYVLQIRNGGELLGPTVYYVHCEIQAFLNLLTGQGTRLLWNRVLLALKGLLSSMGRRMISAIILTHTAEGRMFWVMTRHE